MEFLLNFMQKNSNLQQFLVVQFAQIYGIFMRLGWFEDERFQQPLQDMQAFKSVFDSVEIMLNV